MVIDIVGAKLYKLLPSCIIFYLFTFFPNDVFAQSYGLRFSGHEVVQDKRTSLDLTPNDHLCFNSDTEISFDIGFSPDYADYFGYIFRIIDDQNKNIDLIYDQRSNAKNLQIIIGEKFSKAALKLDRRLFFNKWNTLKIRFDFKKEKLSFRVNDTVLTESIASFAKNRCFKVVFGVNEMKNFKTTDTPPMMIRDITISEEGKLKYKWPLNELNGDVATDLVQGRLASVTRPVWISAKHQNWQLIKSFTVGGNASAAFNPKEETVYFISSDSLFSYSVLNANLNVSSYGGRDLPSGNQAVYDVFEDKLYNFYVDQEVVSVYNPAHRKWSSNFKYPSTLTEYWQLNKFISKSDSSLYIFGGYGQLKYKNMIRRFHIPTRQWDTVKNQGDFFNPRYLSALGTNTTADTAYIIGGYGSISGQQVLNPQNYYDLMLFDVKRKAFKKLYQLPTPEEDFVFGNSLVIDSRSKVFYGLIYPQHKYNSYLQLIKGSLTSPSYQLVGDRIPFKFHDIHTFSDLYFCPTSKKLVAVTLFRNDNYTTDVKIFTIDFPPNLLQVKKNQAESDGRGYLFLLSLGFALIGFVTFIVFKKRRKIKDKKEHKSEISAPAIEVKGIVNERVLDLPDSGLAAENPSPKSSIHLFGNMQVFDLEGNDITRSFTPLVKELFLLILLYSIRWERGVSSEKLNEILWFDKSAKDARNNRSVNIAKLRSILEKLPLCEVSKDTGYWKIDIDFDKVYLDYQKYLSVIRNRQVLSKQEIMDLVDITHKGPLLLNTDYEWLDDFKSEVSNEIVNTYLQYSNSINIADDPEFLIQLTNSVFHFDPVNEDAMILKCKALSILGKHALAKNAFEKFNKEYKTIYGEDFEKSFHSIIGF